MKRQSAAASTVAPLRKTAAAPQPALDVLQAALERGNVRDPQDYLARIIRFQSTGTWLLTLLDEPAPRDVIECAEYPPPTVSQPLLLAA